MGSAARKLRGWGGAPFPDILVIFSFPPIIAYSITIEFYYVF